MMDADVADYYNGERNSAYIAGTLGLSYAGVGAYLLSRKTDFGRGAGWPLVTLGALEAIGAISYAIDVTGKKSHYLDLYARDKAAFQREESEHIHGTTSRFWIYRTVEVAITAAGVAAATYGFAAKNDTWKGIGIALIAVGLPLVIIDTINNNRALRYEETVKSFGVTASAQTFALSYGGAF